MPAITGGIGVCHTYADASADAEMAASVVYNAKTQAPAKCNALDTLLVHAGSAPSVLPAAAARLLDGGVELRCDRRALALLGPLDAERIRPAEERGFRAGVPRPRPLGARSSTRSTRRSRTSRSTAPATRRPSSPKDGDAARRFVDEVDAAVVLVNASTRFNDGGQLGLGAEVAISTNKLHARGPMGLRELTSYKWVAIGDGHVRP